MSLTKWLLNFIWRTKSSGTVRLLPPSQSLKEEPLEWYCPGRYHPVKLGDIFNSRYHIVRKLGWGMYSTVWLAKDTRHDRHIALKILSADADGYFDKQQQWHPRPQTFERLIHQSMDNVKADHPGRKHLPKLLDNFDHVGPHGKHTCLVFQVMGRSLDVFSAQWKPSRIPSPIMQRVTAQLLQALHFLHRECGIIHTDIKATNIMLDLNDPDAKEDQREACIHSYLEQVPIPTGVEHDTFDYVQSRSIYAPIKDSNMVSIQLADLGSACWTDLHLAEFCQPQVLRAPEVIFQLPWGTEIDIWTTAVVTFDMMTASLMFDGKTVESHLAEMVAAVGPFPQDFISRVGNPERIFTSDGFIKNQPRYQGFSLEGSLNGSPSRPEYESPLSEAERRDWLAFIREMLKLDPRARKTARELLEHPWLHEVYTYPGYECDGYDHSKAGGVGTREGF